MLLLGAWQVPCCGYWQAPCGLVLSRALFNCIAYLSDQTAPHRLLRSKKILLKNCMQTELALNFQAHSNLLCASALEPTWRKAIIQNQLVNLVFPCAFQCREEVFAKGKTTFFSQRRMFSQTRTTTRLATVTAPGFFLCNL